MAKSNFGEDLKVELAKRTDELLRSEDIGFTEKARALGNISAYRLSFDPANVDFAVKHAAARNKTVAALVHCNVVPMMDAVFVGKVAEVEEPLTLSAYGATLAVKSGFLLRTGNNNDGHEFRWRPTSRIDDELVPVHSYRLTITRNQLIPAHFRASNMTPVADETLARIDGLDFKIVDEGVNLPELDEAGALVERYDRLGLVGLLGEEVYVELLGEVNKVAV